MQIIRPFATLSNNSADVIRSSMCWMQQSSSTYRRDRHRCCNRWLPELVDAANRFQGLVLSCSTSAAVTSSSMCGIVRGPYPGAAASAEQRSQRRDQHYTHCHAHDSSQHYSSRQMHNLNDFFRMLQDIPVPLRFFFKLQGGRTPHRLATHQQPGRHSGLAWGMGELGHQRMLSYLGVFAHYPACTVPLCHPSTLLTPPPPPLTHPFDTPRLSTRVCEMTQQQQMRHSPPSAAHTASQQQSGRQQQQATSALRPSSSSSRNRDLAG